MADIKYDGVVEAVHYQPDGQVAWVRAYLRRGAAWSDRVKIQRNELVAQIKAGKKFCAGQRVDFMAGTFTLSVPIQVIGPDWQENLTNSADFSSGDHLDGIPIL